MKQTVRVFPYSDNAVLKVIEITKPEVEWHCFDEALVRLRKGEDYRHGTLWIKNHDGMMLVSFCGSYETVEKLEMYITKNFVKSLQS